MPNVHKPHDHYPFENASENKSGDFKVGNYYKHGFSNSRKSKIIFTACSEQQKIIFGHLCTRAGEIPNFFEYRPSKPLNG